MNPAEHGETEELYARWKPVFEIFNVMIDVRYGNFLHLPFSGGAAEQPAKTMDALNYIQALFRQKLDDDQKKHLSKINAPRIRGARRRR